MKTAEVAIEHVLAGMLGILAFLLPFTKAMGIEIGTLTKETIIVLLGIAYLLGVVFDKIADMFLSPFEQMARLREAQRGMEGPEKLYLDHDPFPQDALEFDLRHEGGGRLEWMDSLRSRIRTARGLAVFGLPAALGIAIYKSVGCQGEGCQLSLEGSHLFIGLNLLWTALLLWLSRSKCKFCKMPRTSDLITKKQCDPIKQAKCNMWKRGVCYIFLFVTSSAGAVFIYMWTEHPEAALIVVYGAVVALLALWTWRSMTKTYLSFVRQKLPEILGDGKAQAGNGS